MKKYILFGWYSAIGTLIDCLLLILISLFFKGIVFTAIFAKISGIQELILTILSIVCGSFEKLDTLNKYATSLANFISYGVGVAITFILSAKYAFKVSKKSVNRRATATTIIHILGLIVQTILFNELTWHGWDNGTAKEMTIVINAVLMGLSNIFIVFKKDKDENIIINSEN